MPAAHSILWFMGVFIGLWGMTLIVRGLPPQLAEFVWRRSRKEARSNSDRAALRRRSGDWRLILGGVFAMAAAGVAMAFGLAVHNWTRTTSDLVMPIWSSAALAMAAFSMTLLIWALRGEGTAVPRCPRCRYSMAGGGLVCPECGFTAHEASDFLKPIRRKWTAAFAILLFAVSPSLLVVPNFLRYGPIGLIPTTVMIAGFEWLPREAVGRVGDWRSRQRTGVMASWKGSLGERRQNELLWRWQEQWLSRKANRLLLRPERSVRAAARGWDLGAYELPAHERKEVISRLVTMMCTGDQSVRDAVARESALPMMLEHGVDYSPLVRPYAARLQTLLSDGNPEVSLTAAAMLVLLPDHTSEALPEAAKHYGAPRLAGEYSMAVLHLAASSAHGREHLLDLTVHDNPAFRQDVMWILLLSGEFAGSMSQHFKSLLDHLDVTIARDAAQMLGFFREAEYTGWIIHAARARPAAEGAELIQNVNREHLGRWSHELGQIVATGGAPIGLVALDLLDAAHLGGHDIKPAIPGLQIAIDSKDEELATWAKRLLGLIRRQNEGADLP